MGCGQVGSLLFGSALLYVKCNTIQGYRTPAMGESRSKLSALDTLSYTFFRQRWSRLIDSSEAQPKECDSFVAAQPANKCAEVLA